MKTIKLKNHIGELNKEWDVIHEFYINNIKYMRLRSEPNNDMIINSDHSIIVMDVLKESNNYDAINQTIESLFEDGELDYGRNIQVSYSFNRIRDNSTLAQLLYDESYKDYSFERYADICELKVLTMIAQNISVDYVVEKCGADMEYSNYLKVINMLCRCYDATIYFPELENNSLFDFIENKELVDKLIKIYYNNNNDESC